MMVLHFRVQVLLTAWNSCDLVFAYGLYMLCIDTLSFVLYGFVHMFVTGLVWCVGCIHTCMNCASRIFEYWPVMDIGIWRLGIRWFYHALNWIERHSVAWVTSATHAVGLFDSSFVRFKYRICCVELFRVKSLQHCMEVSHPMKYLDDLQ